MSAGRPRHRLLGCPHPLSLQPCGKALLAYFPKEQREWLYQSVGLEKKTPYSIFDTRRLEKELAEVRKNGFAVDQQENEIGAFCVGMPIFGPFEQVVASISVNGVIQRMAPQFVSEVVTLLRHHTGRISEQLGQPRANLKST